MTFTEKLDNLNKKAADALRQNQEARTKARELGTKYDPPVSASRLNKLNHEIKYLTLLVFMNADNCKWSPETKDIANSLRNPTPQGVVCEAGDAITEILATYKDTKDIITKLTAYCAKNNLLLDYANNIVVEKT